LPGITNKVQAVFGSMVLDQTGTLGFADYISDSNIGGCNDTYILPNGASHLNGPGTGPQMKPITQNFHNSLFNYLFVDGHVETLAPTSNLGATNTNNNLQTGMWTIDPKD